MFFATYVSNLGGGGGGGGGSPTTPGGVDTSIQFNSSGAFGGNDAFTYNKSTSAPSVIIGNSATHGGADVDVWGDTGNSNQFSLFQGSPNIGVGSFLVLRFATALVGTSGSYWNSGSGAGTMMISSGASVVAEDDGTSDLGFSLAGNARFRDLGLSGSWSSGYDLDTTSVSLATTVIPNHVSSYISAPATLLAALTLVMPAAPRDGLELSLGCSMNGITTLTLSANAGQTLTGAITSLTVGQFARYKWLAGPATWVRVG